MKKKLTLILLTICMSLTALTGCKTNNTSVQAATKTEDKSASETEERPENAPSSKSIPKDVKVIAPPVDADGNLPEDFDAEGYYEGFAELAEEQKEKEEAAKKEKDSDKKDDSKTEKKSEKQEDGKTEKESEKQKDSKEEK